MKQRQRIAVLENIWWRSEPTKADFKSYNTQILMNNAFTCYAVKNSGKVEMVHMYQIDDIAAKNNVDSKLKQTICDSINNLPSDCWLKVARELDLK